MRRGSASIFRSEARTKTKKNEKWNEGDPSQCEPCGAMGGRGVGGRACWAVAGRHFVVGANTRRPVASGRPRAGAGGGRPARWEGLQTWRASGGGNKGTRRAGGDGTATRRRADAGRRVWLVLRVCAAVPRRLTGAFRRVYAADDLSGGTPGEAQGARLLWHRRQGVRPHGPR